MPRGRLPSFNTASDGRRIDQQAQTAPRRERGGPWYLALSSNNARLVTLLNVPLAAATGLLLWRSLDWPLVGDAAIFHFIAGQMQMGAVPYRDIIDINLKGAFFCAQAAYPEMRRAGGGKIVNIGSMTSIFGVPFAAPYAASKGGIVQLTRALATAWAKDNIQVNAVLPGWIDTDLTKKARQQVDGLQERVVARTPAGRWGAPDDFAGIAVFLAAPASDFITGVAIPVDGGYSIQG